MARRDEPGPSPRAAPLSAGHRAGTAPPGPKRRRRRRDERQRELGGAETQRRAAAWRAPARSGRATRDDRPCRASRSRPTGTAYGAPRAASCRSSRWRAPGSCADRARVGPHEHPLPPGVVARHAGELRRSPRPVVDLHLDAVDAAVLRPADTADRDPAGGHGGQRPRHLDARHRAHGRVGGPAAPRPVGLLGWRTSSPRSRPATWSPTRSRTARARPCARGSRARRAGARRSSPRRRSRRARRVTAAMGVLADQPSADRDSSCSAAGSTPARARRSRNGTPSQTALPAYGPPTSFDTQVRVRSRSIIGIARSSSYDEGERRARHAADRELPARGVDGRDRERGVDAVEVGVADAERRDAGDARPRRRPGGRARGRPAGGGGPRRAAPRRPSGVGPTTSPIAAHQGGPAEDAEAGGEDGAPTRTGRRGGRGPRAGRPLGVDGVRHGSLGDRV